MNSRAQTQDSALGKVGGPDALPNQGPAARMDLESERAGLDRDVSPVEDFLSTPNLEVSEHPTEFQLEGSHPAESEHACQRRVRPAFLAPSFRDHASRRLCVLGRKCHGKKTNVCKLQSINDTQNLLAQSSGFAFLFVGAVGSEQSILAVSTCTCLHRQLGQSPARQRMVRF